MSYKNLLESAKRYQIAFRNCSTLGEQMMLRQSFYNYVMEGYARAGYLSEERRHYPTLWKQIIRQWIANNETLDPARFPNGYDPNVPPNMPGPGPNGEWGLWHPKRIAPPEAQGDPGPFWRGWGEDGLGDIVDNPWHWDNGEWKYITIPTAKPGSVPPSVDLPEMLKQRYIQILNERLK